jgi:predicted NodU family carbamoyl transferase
MHSREKGEGRMFDNVFSDASLMLVLTFWSMFAMIIIIGAWWACRKQKRGKTMKLGSLARYRRKKYSQKTLVEYDEKLQRHLENIDDRMFDRETRNSTLKNGEFSPPSGTLFDAIYKELKHKEEREKQSYSFSKMLSRLRENRARKQLTGLEQSR